MTSFGAFFLGQALMSGKLNVGARSPAVSHNFWAWTGFGVFAMYAAIALIGAIVAFRRRDA